MSDDSPDELLRPREVADLFGVRTATIARWAREGRLMPFRTPGGHRRYSRDAIRRVLAQDTAPGKADREWVQDAVRLSEH